MCVCVCVCVGAAFSGRSSCENPFPHPGGFQLAVKQLKIFFLSFFFSFCMFVLNELCKGITN